MSEHDVTLKDVAMRFCHDLVHMTQPVSSFQETDILIDALMEENKSYLDYRRPMLIFVALCQVIF